VIAPGVHSENRQTLLERFAAAGAPIADTVAAQGSAPLGSGTDGDQDHDGVAARQ
jgi:hypothetical protein